VSEDRTKCISKCKEADPYCLVCTQEVSEGPGGASYDTISQYLTDEVINIFEAGGYVGGMCAVCMDGREPDGDGYCVVSTTKTRLENCWDMDASLSVDYRIGQACVEMTPAEVSGASDCDVFSSVGGLLLTMNLSAYSRPLTAVIDGYSYRNTTSLCLTCPDDVLDACSRAMRESQSASVSIESFTHVAVMEIAEMTTKTVDYSKCFITPSSLIQKYETAEICARVTPTGACPTLSKLTVTGLSVLVLGETETLTYDLDPLLYDPEQTEYCYQCSGTSDGRFAAVTTQLHYTTTKGQLRLTATVEGNPVSIAFELPASENTNLYDCVSAGKMTVYGNKVVVELTANTSYSDFQSVCRNPSRAANFELTAILSNHVTGDFTSLTTLTQKFNISRDNMLTISCGTGDLACQATLGKYLATHDPIVGELLVRHLTSTGSELGISRRYITDVSQSCFSTVTAQLYSDKVCLQLIQSESRDCLLADAVGDAVYTLTLGLSSTDPASVEEQILGTISMRRPYDHSTSDLCFSCSDFDGRTDDCSHHIDQLQKNIDRAICKYQVTVQDVESRVYYSSKFYRKNYFLVWIGVGIVIGVISLSAIAYVIVAMCAIRREAKRLSLKRKRRS